MTELNVLFITAVNLAFIHTVIGVDHYIPFVAMSKAGGWAMKKTLLIVLICGTGHVLASVALGIAGITLSAGLTFLTGIEEMRGEIASYFLIAFGLIYTIYGIRAAIKNKTHRHILPDGRAFIHAHSYERTSEDIQNHNHGDKAGKNFNTFWWLFILLVLGPCEPLIPLLMYPAAAHSTAALILITVCFAVCTIATMLLMVVLGLKGINLLSINKLERYSHALAGAAILICGISVVFLPI